MTEEDIREMILQNSCRSYELNRMRPLNTFSCSIPTEQLNL